jgi:hypothetical protein
MSPNTKGNSVQNTLKKCLQIQKENILQNTLKKCLQIQKQIVYKIHSRNVSKYKSK